MFQEVGHDPMDQKSVVVHLKGQLQRQGGEEQPLYSACCALSLAGLLTMRHGQMALLELEERLWMKQLESTGKVQQTRRQDSVVEQPLTVVALPHYSLVLLFALQPDQ